MGAHDGAGEKSTSGVLRGCRLGLGNGNLPVCAFAQNIARGQLLAVRAEKKVLSTRLAIALDTRGSRGAASADAMSAVKKDIKDMATSVNVGLANLQKPSTQKSLKAKIRARLHFVVALVGLGVVAAVGTYIAKRGLPDIDPVKVRGARAETKRAAVSPLPSLDRAPNRKDGTPGSEPRVSWCLFLFLTRAARMVVVSPRRRRSDAARVVRGSRCLTHRPVPFRHFRHDPWKTRRRCTRRSTRLVI